MADQQNNQDAAAVSRQDNTNQNPDTGTGSRSSHGNEPGSAGNTPSDSVIEDPRNVAPGDGSPQDTVPTRSS